MSGVSHGDGGKPKRREEKFGLDVEIRRETLENDQWAQNTLREIGKAMPIPGMKYIGSAAFHVYAPDVPGLKEVATKSQFTLGDLNEDLAASSANLFIQELYRHYGHTPGKSPDKRDKR